MPANFPNNPVINQLYSYSGATWKFTGTKWQLVTVTDGNTGTLFTYSNTAPQAPSLGDRWLNSETLRQSIYINDGDTDQWVEPVSIGLAGAAKSLNNLANVSINTDLLPAANVTHDLGSSSLRWRDLYLSGNSIILGAATLTSTGSAVNLPAGTTVGGQNVATSGDVSTGGGPKITNLQITDNSWAVLDDTAVDTAGGYTLITGTNFVSGALVYFNQTPATSVAFVSATTLQVTVPALTAGTYVVYVINPDGGTAIRVPGLTASANPAWQTASALPEQYDGVAITLNLVATEATSYTLTSGSLPPGLSLDTSTGVITGTVTGVTVDTTYTFTVRATDAELQDSPRTFTVTITVSDPYFKLTTLLLSGSAMSSNTVVKDSSTNNFNLTVYGDARASNRTPYGTGWSNLFSSNRLNIATTGFAPGTGNFTVEAWIYPTSYNSASAVLTVTTTGGLWLGKLNSNWVLRAYSVADQLTTTTLPTLNTWTHVAWVRNGSTATIYFNGNSVVSGTVTYNFVSGSLAIGDDGGGGSYFLGYISNLRYTTTAVYTANFTPATTNLTALAGTQLLTCQDNRFRDTSANAYTITTTGTPTVSSFNPFNITNTGVNGSMYFDGTGDYLSTSNPAFAVGTGAFTIEAWVYPFNVSSKIVGSLASSVDPAGDRGIGFYTDGARIGRSVTAQFDDISTSIMPVAYQWNHIALVRENTSTNGVKFYVNGLLGGQGTSAISVNKQQVVVGRQYPSENASYFSGYISSVRWTNAAVYASAFTPPTSLLTAIANTQLLTCQFDQPHNNHTFLDSSSNQFVITRNGNATQGTFSPFSQSGWSVYINNGTSSQIRISDNAALRIGTSAFTIESWVYPTGFSEPFYVLRKRVNGNLGAGTWAFTVATNGSVLLEQVQGPATIAQTSAGLVALNTWTHVAVSRDSSNNVKIFVNGTIQATATSSYNFNDASNPISLLCDYDGRNASSIGYASNLRFVIGSAVYTANFTPATSNLTSSSQGAVAADVKILTFQDNRFRDASTNNFSITIAGSPSVQSFSPFAPTAVYSPVTHGGSAYVNATSTYLALPASTPLVNIADWTVDFWMYPTSYVNAQGIFGASNGGGASLKIAFQINGSSITLFKTGTGIISISQPPLNQWTHLSVVRSSSTGLAYIFVNGVLGTSGSFGSEAVTSNFQLFTNGEGATSGMYGYLSSFRVSNIARQVTAFTVPTQPYQADTNTILLTNFTDAAILDSTGRNVLETAADAKSSSVVTKFTGGSMYFDGTGDYLAVPANFLHNQLYASNRSFTIEFWIYLQAYAGAGVAATVISTYGGGGGTDGWRIETSPNAPANAIRWVSNGSDTACSATIELNTWIHYAFTYNGTTVKVFKNGVLGNTATTSWTNNNGRMFIGTANAGLAFPITGYLTDVRITNAERYTATFTAPTAPARLK